MSRIKLVALAVVAALCIGAVATATAMAAEAELLNSEGNALVKNKFSATSGETKIETAGGTSIKCKADTVHGVVSSSTSGEVTILYTGCTTSEGLFSCKGGKDASGEPPAGSIYVLAGITPRALNAEEDAVLTTIHKPGTSTAGELEVECSGVKVKLKGSFLTQPFLGNGPNKSLVLEAKETKGAQGQTEYENAKGEKVKCEGLEASVSGGAFEKTGIEETETVAFEEEAALFQQGGTFRFFIEPVRVLNASFKTGTVEVENISGVELEVTTVSLSAVTMKKFGFAITANACNGMKVKNRHRCAVSIELKNEGAGEYRALLKAKTPGAAMGEILLFGMF